MTTLCPDFLVVDENVARNPVARAIARHNIRQAIRDYSVRLHLLTDGEPVPEDAQCTARVLGVAIRVLEQRGQAGSVEARVMAGGMSALTQLADRGWRWRTLDLPAVDLALQHATDVICGATALEQQRAHRYVIGLERAAVAGAWA